MQGGKGKEGKMIKYIKPNGTCLEGRTQFWGWVGTEVEDQYSGSKSIGLG